MRSSVKIATDPDKKQTLNAFNILVLIFVGLGSVSYGYTASVIGITIGLLIWQHTTGLVADSIH